MVTRIERIVVDDLDASADSVGTYRFALEGVEYEIDLSEPNLQRLRAALAPFTAAGRRLTRHQSRKAPAVAGRTRTSTGAVRRWWAEHERSHDLPRWRAHGRIPRETYDAYATDHPANNR